MHINRHDLIEYILANPAVYIATHGDTQVVLTVVENSDIGVQGWNGYVTDMYHNVLEFKRYDDDATDIKLTVDKNLILKVKDSILQKTILTSIKYLADAGVKMVQHYIDLKNHDGVDGKTYRTKDIGLRVYVLDALDYQQSGKGAVIINPYSDGTDATGDTIRGYIYDYGTGTIKYETVQAWRYRRIKKAETMYLISNPLMREIYNAGWVDILV